MRVRGLSSGLMSLSYLTNLKKNAAGLVGQLSGGEKAGCLYFVQRHLPGFVNPRRQRIRLQSLRFVAAMDELQPSRGMKKSHLPDDAEHVSKLHLRAGGSANDPDRLNYALRACTENAAITKINATA